MDYFKPFYLMNEEDKHEVSEMTGKIMLWILEGRSTVYMAENLKLDLWQVEYNIDEVLHTFRNQVGKKRYLKALFEE